MLKFYLLIVILSILCVILLIKNIIMKNMFKNIVRQTNKIINTDTNSIISRNYPIKELDSFIVLLNNSLKELRMKQIEYELGISDLKKSITNITHDLRTPLSAIIGYMELIDTKDLTEKHKEYIEIINKKANQMIILTEQLFDYTKCLDSGKNINREKVCINYILEESICDYYELFKINNIEPFIKITDYKIIRNLDINMLKRIFENIISNGIKYSEGDFRSELHDDGTIIFINKTTLLDKTIVGKMFDRYYTVQNADKSSGIGLSIAKQLTEINGGNIKAFFQDKQLIIEVVFNE